MCASARISLRSASAEATAAENNRKTPKYDAANAPRAAAPSGPPVSNTNIYACVPSKLESNPHSFPVLVAPQQKNKNKNKKCAGLDGSRPAEAPPKCNQSQPNVTADYFSTANLNQSAAMPSSQRGRYGDMMTTSV